MTLPDYERNWLLLWKGDPGKRFQNHYQRSHQSGTSQGFGIQLLRLAVALILLCVGIMLILLPLVYLPFLVLSAALFAAESQGIARFLDQSESTAREAWSRLKTRFGISTRGANMIFGAIGIGCVALGGMTCYNTFFR